MPDSRLSNYPGANFMGPLSPWQTQGGTNQMGSNPELYQAHSQSSSHQDPMLMLGQIVAHLMGQQQQQPAAAGFNMAGALKEMRNTPQADANATTGMPSYMPGSQSPFNTGYFKSPAEREAINQQHAPFMPSVASLAHNPYYNSQGMGAEGAIAASPRPFQLSPGGQATLDKARYGPPPEAYNQFPTPAANKKKKPQGNPFGMMG